VNRDYHKWYSPHLRQEMELLKFGHQGQNLLVFPTSKGRFFDFENFSMIEALTWHIEQGWVQCTCVDSVDAQSWYNFTAPPQERVRRHMEYDAYVKNEVIPFIHSQTGNNYIGTVGCSFGGYHAVNFGLRHPDVINKIISLGGSFEINSFLGSYFDLDAYYNSPVDFMGGMKDDSVLEMIRRQRVYLMSGQYDILKGENENLGGILRSRGVPCEVHVWEGAHHDWYWWKQQILHCL